MKKIFSTLTLVLCLVAMVSCGGKKEDKAAPQTDPVKAKVESFYKASVAADENGDYDEIERINAEVEAYYNSLSDKEKAKFEEYVIEVVQADMYDDADEYVEEVVEDVYEYADDMTEDAYEYADKMTSDAYKYADDMAEDAYEYAEKMTSDAYEYADEMTENAYEYAEKMTDDAYEYADKAMEDAYEYAEKALEDAYDFDW